MHLGKGWRMERCGHGVLVARPRAGTWLIAGNAATGGSIQHGVVCHHECMNVITSDRCGVCRACAMHHHGMPVEPSQTILCGHPQKPLYVLGDACYVHLWQPLFHAVAGEPRSGVQRHRWQRAPKQYDSKGKRLHDGKHSVTNGRSAGTHIKFTLGMGAV